MAKSNETPAVDLSKLSVDELRELVVKEQSARADAEKAKADAETQKLAIQAAKDQLDTDYATAQAAVQQARILAETAIQAKLQAQNDLARAAETGSVPVVKIRGKAKLKLQAAGGEVTKTVTFVDGTAAVRDLTGEIIGSEALFTIANGGEASLEDQVKYPALRTLTQDSAVHLLTEFATRGVSFLKIS